MISKLKSDMLNYGDQDVLVVNYHKVKKGDGKTYVEVSFSGKDAVFVDKKSDYQLTTRFYANKEHAQSIVLPVVKSILKKKSRGVVELDYDELMSSRDDINVFVTGLGEENIYFQIGGLDFFVKSAKTFERFETPKWVKLKKIKGMI